MEVPVEFLLPMPGRFISIPVARHYILCVCPMPHAVLHQQMKISDVVFVYDYKVPWIKTLPSNNSIHTVCVNFYAIRPITKFVYLAEGKKLNIMTWKGIFHCLIASYPAGGSFLLQKLMVKHSWGGPFSARHWQPGQFSQYIRHITPAERTKGRQGVRYTGKKNTNNSSKPHVKASRSD